MIFGKGECTGCVSKADEIAYLRGQVAALQAKLLEIASPGGNARLAQADRIAANAPPKPKLIDPDAKVFVPRPALPGMD